MEPEAAASPASRRRGRLLPWVISMAWSALILGLLGLSQWHQYIAHVSWKGGETAIGIRALRGSFVFFLKDNPLLEGPPLSGWRSDLSWRTRHEKIGYLRNNSGWYGKWDAEVSNDPWERFLKFTVPLLALLVPPWLWVGWRWWRTRRREGAADFTGHSFGSHQGG